NVGIPASRRIRSPSATSLPPIQDARIGLLFRVAQRLKQFAVSVASVMAWGVRITSTPSFWESQPRISTAFSNRAGVASPKRSTGLFLLQNGGSSRLSFSKLFSDSL